MVVEQWDKATIELLDKNFTDANWIRALSLKGLTCVHEALVELDGPLSRLPDMVKRSMRLIAIARAKLQKDGVADLVVTKLEDLCVDLIKETA
jgi:hypothetical protein